MTEPADSENLSNIPCKVSLKNDNNYNCYIFGEIGEASYYHELLSILDSMGVDDELNLYINSEGGNMDTAAQITHAINRCNGKAIVHIDGTCASAATFIFLGATYKGRVGEYSSMLIHAPKFSTEGSTQHLNSQINFQSRYTEKLYNKIYNNFLTLGEIDSVINHDAEIWLDADEIKRRLASMA